MRSGSAWLLLAATLMTLPIDVALAATVNGTASFLQRMELPPSAVFEARVEDISRADAAAEVIGSVRIDNPGTPPIAFTIEIDPKKVDERRRYVVRGSIAVDGKVVLTTDRAYPVLTHGHGREVAVLLRAAGGPRPGLVGVSQGTALGALPGTFSGDLPCADCAALRYRLNLFPDGSYFLSTLYEGRSTEPVYDIGGWAVASDRSTLVLHGGHEAPLRFRIVDASTLRMQGQDGRDIESKLSYALTRQARFEPMEPRLVVRGMYRSVADVGTFTECLTRQRWPVAQLGANAALEREYLKVQREPDAELLVNVEGEVKQLPKAEGGMQPTLVVQRFIGAWPGETCGARFATAELVNMYWKLTALNGKPVVAAANQREPGLTLQAAGMHRRATGSGGCNRFTGNYELNGNNLRIDTLAGTMMACPDGMDIEKEYLETLPRTRTWKVVGQHLELFDEKGTTLARFEARALR
jgi:copper homeostasis protein (lipoprotein)